LFQNENRRYLTTNKLSNRVQEKYLSLCQIFIEKAVPLFCTNVLQNIVPEVVKEVALSQAVSVVDIEKYLNSMLSMCDKICNEGKKKIHFQSSYIGFALRINPLKANKY